MVSLFPIQFDGIVVAKKAKTILGPLNVAIKAGGPTIVIGPNGAGKTTFLRLIHGLERAKAGTLSFGLTDEKEIYRRQCFVFQKPIMLRRSALDNVAYPLILRGEAKTTAREQAYAMIERVGLREAADTRATFLSGGEAQKLAIARALVTKPELLILDEPSASLDGSATQDIEALISSVSNEGIEVLMTTHHMGQARRLARRIIFLNKGRLLEISEANSFWNAPESNEAQRFIMGEII